MTSWALRCCQAEMCARLAVYTSPLLTAAGTGQAPTEQQQRSKAQALAFLLYSSTLSGELLPAGWVLAFPPPAACKC